MGRPKGSRNKGYFFRVGRGWHATQGKQQIPLTDADGNLLRDQNTPEDVVKDAYARFRLAQGNRPKGTSGVTVLDVCIAYLKHAKIESAGKTFKLRSQVLFDLCYGVSPKYRLAVSDAFRLSPDPKGVSESEWESSRLHSGYGHLPVSVFGASHIDEWLASHPHWTSGGRNLRIRILLRAFNFAIERRMIEKNPARGFRLPKSRGRVTYISPDQEKALLEHAKPALASVIRILIRTGMRAGIEFCALEARHVSEKTDGLKIYFPAEEAKGRKKSRTILVKDPETIASIKEAMDRNPKGPIFRFRHQPWVPDNLSKMFGKLVRKLRTQGVDFDKDCCLNSCRHTYAKRILQGYWSGKPTNIETLARLMGNTPEICRRHYLQWSEVEDEHLWASA
jgi:integrase